MMRSSTAQCTGRTLQPRVFAALVGSLLVVPSVATAQKYNQLPVKLELRANSFLVQSVLRGELPLDENRQMLDQFFHEFIFAQLTVVESPPKTGGKRGKLPPDLGKQRRDLFNRYFASATDESARQHLIEITFAAMKDLIAGNYHPATRFNATLIVGEIDQRPSTGFGTTATPPVPLAEAAPYLLGLLANDEMPDAVKVAALVGLERHARYGLADEQRPQATAAALALVNQRTPPGNRLPEGHVWMRRQAADLLATLGEVGPQNEVLKALHGLLAEPGAPRSQRCAAADDLSRLRYTPESAPDAMATMPDLIKLALDSCKEDTALGVKRLQQEALNPRRRQFYEDEPVESLFPRRRLATVFSCVRKALVATSAVADPKTKAAAAALTGQIDAAMKLLEDTMKLDQELIVAFTKSCGRLAEAINNLPAPGEPTLPEPVQETATENQDLFSGDNAGVAPAK